MTFPSTSEEIRSQATSAGDGTVSPLSNLLVAVAFIGGCFGMLFASQATLGVAILAFSVLLAVVSRIVQANKHHAALMKRIGR